VSGDVTNLAAKVHVTMLNAGYEALTTAQVADRIGVPTGDGGAARALVWQQLNRLVGHGVVERVRTPGSRYVRWRRVDAAAADTRRVGEPAWAARVIAAALSPATRLVAFVAVPGAGKSTIAGLLAEALPESVLISSDQIRKELGDEADQSANAMVFQIAFERLRCALDTSAAVALWDATNAQQWARRDLVAACGRPGVDTLAVLLRVPLAAALNRNAHRPRQVPPAAIEQMHRDLAEITTGQLCREGFTRAIELSF
jgi:predicted kinase